MSAGSDCVAVLVTARTLKEARTIARGLLDTRLAACVNILPPMESIYRWRGKVETGRERLLLVKTSRAIFPEAQAAIRKLHSYTTPEIICLPIVEGSRDYLDWLIQSLKPFPGVSARRAVKLQSDRAPDRDQR